MRSYPLLNGRSPAQEKQREKRRLKEAQSFGEFGERWLKETKVAGSARTIRRSVFERDILPTFRKQLLSEISAGDSRRLPPSRYDADAPMSWATFNRVTKAVFLILTCKLR